MTTKKAGRPRAYPNTLLAAFTTVRITKTQARKLKKLGGSNWIRKQIDATP